MKKKYWMKYKELVSKCCRAPIERIIEYDECWPENSQVYVIDKCTSCLENCEAVEA